MKDEWLEYSMIVPARVVRYRLSLAFMDVPRQIVGGQLPALYRTPSATPGRLWVVRERAKEETAANLSFREGGAI